MKKIVLDLAVTLDGFIEGTNGEIDWCKMDDEMGFEKFLEGIDSIFYGRVSYNLWGQFQPDTNASTAEKNLWQEIHSKNKYVFSKTKEGDGKATFIDSNIFDRVTEIKNNSGKNIWLYGGAGLISTFINLDLIDVYQLAVHPIILGQGKPMFTNIKNRVNLILNNVKNLNSGVTLLSYGVDH